MNRILALTPPGALAPVLLVSLLALGTGIGLLGASAWLIASAALEPPLYTLAIGITAVRACGIGRAVFRYLERLLSHRVAFRSLTRIRIALYDFAAGLLPLREGPARQGDFLQDLLKGSDALRDFFVRALLPPVSISIATGLVTYFLAQAIGAAALLLPGFLLGRLALPMLFHTSIDEEQRERAAAYRSLLLDRSTGREELMAAGADPALSGLDLPAKALLAADMANARRDTRLDALGTLLDAALLVLLLLFLSFPVLRGEMTGITLAVWFLLLQSLLIEWNTLPEALRQMKTSLAASRRLLRDGWDIKREKRAPQAAFSFPEKDVPLLAAEHISFSYEEGAPILQDVSFQLHRREHTAILGASGAGKTTLAQLLLRVWPPEEGSLTLRGVPYEDIPKGAFHTEIAALPQGSVLFASSIRENFKRYRPGISEMDMLHTLDAAQLTELVEAMAAGIDTPIGPNGAFLSGGQRNRLLTAIALAGSEEILLLDEPTAGLDRETADRLMSAVLAEADRRQKTLLLITHEEEYAARLPRQLRLSSRLSPPRNL